MLNFKLMKIATVIIAVLISFTSQSFSVTSSSAFARTNWKKTHYLVCVPEGITSDKEGYTAVFDAKTHRLKFKIDKYFKDKMVFLSDDGTELIRLNRREDANRTNELQFYGRSGFLRTIRVFQGKIELPDDCGTSLLWISDCSQESGKICLYTADSVYSVYYQLPELSVSVAALPADYSPVKVESGLLRSDSLFGIQNLKVGRKSFMEKLAADLNRKLVSEGAAFSEVNFSLRIGSDGQLTFLFMDAETNQNPVKGRMERDEKLSQQVDELVKSYRYSGDLVPNGLPYWPLNGTIYLGETPVNEK